MKEDKQDFRALWFNTGEKEGYTDYQRGYDQLRFRDLFCSKPSATYG